MSIDLGFPVFLVVGGLVTVIQALTKPYIMNEEAGPPTKQEREKYKATPRSRLIAVAFGLVVILIGISKILKG